MRRALIALAILALALLWLLAWPVPVEPVAWQPPIDRGYTGDHALNTRLAAAEIIPIDGDDGPEDLSIGPDGALYCSMHSGAILRLDPTTDRLEPYAHTGGRPLGIEHGPDGRLYVADAFRGLLRVEADGATTVLADTADGRRIAYADDLDIAADGTVYFTDATRFDARDIGDTFKASLLDINEHGGHGRLLAWRPDGTVATLVDGLQFANGVTLDHRGDAVLIVESGSYRVVRHHLRGPRAGETEVVLDNLPGFPDNVARGRDGRYWVGLISPRNAILDRLAGSPALRRIIERLPAFARPKARPHGHLVAFDDAGRVLADLQAPEGPPVYTTGAIETDRYLYVSSLRAEHLARLPRTEVFP